jgi:hypothetical protein
VSSSSTLARPRRGHARPVQAGGSATGVTRLAVEFGEWVLLARDRPAPAATPTLRQACRDLIGTGPARPAMPDLDFCAAPAQSLTSALGPAVLHCGRASTTVFYPAADCDAGLAQILARALAQFPRPGAAGYRIERLEPGAMPPLVPLIVTSEGWDVIAYCRADLITARLAQALEILLAAWRVQGLAPLPPMPASELHPGAGHLKAGTGQPVFACRA